MPDVKPFAVRYKSGSDKSILPGLHGRYDTMAKAKAGLESCARFFGGGKKNKDGFIVGRAIIGIVVDKAALALQKEEQDAPDELTAVMSEPVEYDEVAVLKAENERLKTKLSLLGAEPEEEDEEPDEEPEEEETAARKPARV